MDNAVLHLGGEKFILLLNAKPFRGKPGFFDRFGKSKMEFLSLIM